PSPTLFRSFRRPAVFKTAAINRSATPPSWDDDLRPPPDSGAVSSTPEPVRQAGSGTSIARSCGADLLDPSQVRSQHLRDLHASVRPLVLLEDRHQRAPHGQPRSVEGVEQAGLLARGRPVADLRPPGL